MPHAAHGRALLNSCSGSIGHLLLCLPESEARQFGAVYCGLIDALPAKTLVTMVVEHDAMPFVECWAAQLATKREIEIIDAGSNVRLTPWVRDGQLALSPVVEDGPVVLKSRTNTRKNDGHLADVLHANGICQVVAAQFDFEGGNLLFGDDYVIAGIDAFRTMPGETDADKQMAFANGLAEFDPARRRIITVQSRMPVPRETWQDFSLDGTPWQEVFYFRNSTTTRQPLFHIDMFISLAGKTSDGRPRLLVADPVLAARLLGEDVHPCAMAEHFDAIANGLRQDGFEVVRNPVAYIYMDRSERAQRVWYHATSNNVLVQECAEAGNIVWLPQFGHDNWPELEVIDACNQQLWESFGYEVRPIPKCQLLAENAGGIHCMTNVLVRSQV